jgi:hypothetical protein
MEHVRGLRRLCWSVRNLLVAFAQDQFLNKCNSDLWRCLWKLTTAAIIQIIQYFALFRLSNFKLKKTAPTQIVHHRRRRCHFFSLFAIQDAN